MGSNAMAGPAEYLKLPYGRVVTPESDGSFRAEVLEFPGCVVTAEEPAAALEKLEVAAADWIETAIAGRRLIPEPLANSRYSGKMMVHMPKSVHQKAALLAEREGVSLNIFIVACVVERMGTDSP